MNEKIKKLVTASLFAALICVATLLIQIPTVTKGYVNLGDCFVLIAGWVCGAQWGFAAAGIGSALADLIAGYAIYAPASLIIKGAMAVIAVLGAKIAKENAIASHIFSAVCAELFMALGYFAFEWAIITGNFTASVIGIPENLIQGAVGVLASVALMTTLERTKAINLLRFK